MQDIDEGVAAALGIDRNRGVLIRSVTPGGPAARAGIQQGDVVVTVAGQPVTPDQTLAYIVAQQAIGARVPIELIRHGQRRNVTIAIAERPSEEELARLERRRRAGARRRRRRRQARRATRSRPASARPSRASASRSRR